MDCKHLVDSKCLVASSLAKLEVSARDDACRACLESLSPKQPNYVTAAIARSAMRRDGGDDGRLKSLEPLLTVGLPANKKSTDGCGSYLKSLLQSIGIVPKFDCDCESLLREMNRLGVEGCKRERERLVADLKLNAHHYTWIDRIRAARRVAQSELVLRIDITDPIGWLFDEAVRRYEVIELGAKKNA